jgi:Protein of unknown function (DUF3224)
MTRHSSSAFEVTKWEESPILGSNGGAKVTRASVQMSLDGDLAGDGIVEWLMSYGEDGTATFVGLERVVGSVQGHAGSFVLRHTGTFDGQTAKAALEVVPGSGTDALRTMKGDGTLVAGMGKDGEREITLDYEL